MLRTRRSARLPNASSRPATTPAPCANGKAPPGRSSANAACGPNSACGTRSPTKPFEDPDEPLPLGRPRPRRFRAAGRVAGAPGRWRAELQGRCAAVPREVLRAVPRRQQAEGGTAAGLVRRDDEQEQTEGGGRGQAGAEPADLVDDRQGRKAHAAGEGPAQAEPGRNRKGESLGEG